MVKLNSVLPRKGQSAIEFVILMSFALLLLGFLTVVIQNNIVSTEADRREARIDEVMNILFSEINFAEMSPDLYTREFYLPTNIDGVDYSISSTDNSREILISYLDKQYVYFLPIDLVNARSIEVGKNTMRKTCGTFRCTISLQ